VSDHRVVLVSGIPAAGKSAVAGPLASALGFGLLGKDQIKEVLADALGADHSAQWSRCLGAAAMELLWALAASQPSVVLDANFWTEDERLRHRIAARPARLVEVHCACPVPVAAARYAARAASRHPVHAAGGDTLAPEHVARSGRPAGLGELITLDTSGPVDIPALAAAVRAGFARSPGAAAG
jgi:predicted kinase